MAAEQPALIDVSAAFHFDGGVEGVLEAVDHQPFCRPGARREWECDSRALGDLHDGGLADARGAVPAVSAVNRGPHKQIGPAPPGRIIDMEEEGIVTQRERVGSRANPEVVGVSFPGDAVQDDLRHHSTCKNRSRYNVAVTA